MRYDRLEVRNPKSEIRNRYDLVVIGSGPEAREAALAAAGRNRRVAVIERRPQAAALREALKQLAAGGIHGDNVLHQLQQIARQAGGVTRDQFGRRGIEVFTGDARFVGSREIEIDALWGRTVLAADRILIASGTRPARPGFIPFDGRSIVDADELLALDGVPESLMVIGGGATGIGCGLLYAALGAQVTLIDARRRLLDDRGRPISGAVLDRARSLGINLRLGDEAIGIDRLAGNRVSVQLENGEFLVGETALYSVGRVGDTNHLNLPAAGLHTDERGRLWCNADQQTWAEHIYGAGDVVGFRSRAGLASKPIGGPSLATIAHDKDIGHAAVSSRLVAN